MDQQLTAIRGKDLDRLPPDDEELPIPEPFNCELCLEDTWDCTLVAGSIVCFDCVRESILPLFHNALEHEWAYPPEFGMGTILDPDDFVHWLGAEFIKRYEQMEKEYHTPQFDRVYCKGLIYAEHVPSRGEPVKKATRHNGYTQPMPKWEEGVERATKEGRKMVECGAMVCTRKPIELPENRYTSLLLPQCWSCHWRVCTVCGERIWQTSHFQRHQCLWKPVDRTKALEGMVKGKDYQTCPNKKCGEVVALHDGCNFIRCPQTSCNMGMCFLCGEGPLDDDDADHWSLGKPCPRFNRPGAGNALYDV